MKAINPIFRVSYIFLLAGILFSCLKETEAERELATPSTFIRYFNGGYSDEAMVAEQTPDEGFILLGTTEVQLTDAVTSTYKAKLIKTDRYGNLLWQKLYPPFDSGEDTLSFTGRALLTLKDDNGSLNGYVIVGDSI